MRLPPTDAVIICRRLLVPKPNLGLVRLPLMICRPLPPMAEAVATDRYSAFDVVRLGPRALS